MDAISRAYSKGPYERERLPSGGQSFGILFHLSGGESLPCIYYQTAEASGLYTDGEAHIFLTGLDLRAVWENLECAGVQASAEKEFFGWPDL